MLRNISSVPTKREVLLLAIIFTFFVWAFSGDQRPLSFDLITAFLPKQDLFNEEIPVEDWRTRLSWSSESDVPPQTNIVLHAPGMGLRPDVWSNLARGRFRMDRI